MSRRGWILFLALGVIWGIPYLLIRVAVATLDPLVLAFGRTLIGALLLLPLAARRGALPALSGHWKWLVVFTLVEISAPWLLLGHAETRLNSSTTGLLIAGVPLITAVIVSQLGHERLGARRIAGLGVGFAGVAALVGIDIHFDDWIAIGEIAIVSICYATGPVIIDRKLAGVPPLAVVAASLALAALFYAPFVPWLWPATPSATSVGAVVALGIFCTATAFMLFFALIAEVGPARATVITYVNPLVAMALGVTILREPFTLGMAVGFPLVISGSVLATWRSPPAAVEPPRP